MTQRVTLIFDIPDDDMEQVESMLNDVVETYKQTGHVLDVGDIPDDLGMVFVNVTDYTSEEVLKILRDKVNINLIANWNRMDDVRRLREIVDVDIMLDYLSDGLMDDLRRARR
jgi:hypothetical protein